MKLLTNRKRDADRALVRELRKQSNEGIKIYNKSSSMKRNPFAGDTTVLDWKVDNRTDVLLLTEKDVIDSVLHPRRVLRTRKSDVQLVPDMVCDEIKDYYLGRINGSRLRGAISLKNS